MKRVYNFSAGPAVLPEEVLKEAADEMLDYNGTRHVRNGNESSFASRSKKLLTTAEAGY